MGPARAGQADRRIARAARIDDRVRVAPGAATRRTGRCRRRERAKPGALPGDAQLRPAQSAGAAGGHRRFVARPRRTASSGQPGQGSGHPPSAGGPRLCDTDRALCPPQDVGALQGPGRGPVRRDLGQASHSSHGHAAERCSFRRRARRGPGARRHGCRPHQLRARRRRRLGRDGGACAPARRPQRPFGQGSDGPRRTEAAHRPDRRRRGRAEVEARPQRRRHRDLSDSPRPAPAGRQRSGAGRERACRRRRGMARRARDRGSHRPRRCPRQRPPAHRAGQGRRRGTRRGAAYRLPDRRDALQAASARRDVQETGLLDLPAPEGRLHLRRGDTLRLVRHGQGHNASDGSARKRVAVATVACTLPEALEAVRKDERIWFDDGRIGGVVRRITSKGVEVEITARRRRGLEARGRQGHQPARHPARPARTHGQGHRRPGDRRRACRPGGAVVRAGRRRREAVAAPPAPARCEAPRRHPEDRDAPRLRAPAADASRGDGLQGRGRDDRARRPCRGVRVRAPGRGAGRDAVGLRGSAHAGRLGDASARVAGQDRAAIARRDHRRGDGRARRVRDAQQGPAHRRGAAHARRHPAPHAVAPVEEAAVAAGAEGLERDRRRSTARRGSAKPSRAGDAKRLADAARPLR